MPKPNCRIICHSNYEHLQQVYTGFFQLHKKGIINLSQRVEKIPLGKYQEVHVKVIVNDRFTLYYDMHDCGEILPEYLENVDFYFKRSYAPEFLDTLPDKEKVFPYGLNYQTYIDGFDPFLFQRRHLYEKQEKFKIFLKAIGLFSLLNKPQTGLKALNFEPSFQTQPKILFMARVWNPEQLPDKAQRQATEELNQMRAECIKALKKEFKENFFGGLAVDDYSQAKFKDVLLPTNSISNQKQYFEILKQYPICIATKGLCNSNGWKLAEYVALSKAIVSEKLHFEVPGDFCGDKNYLEFATVDECVEKTLTLFKNAELRRQMITNNYDYYQNYLRPDKLILNTLQKLSAKIENGLFDSLNV